MYYQLFFMKRIILLFSILFINIGLMLAQNKQATGVVTDDSGEPVIGASIIVKGTTTGTVTDLDGRFSLSIPEGNQTLEISYIGMLPQTVQAASNMRVILKADDHVLEEIIVTGYGVTKKAAFTGSAQVVTSKDLEDTANDNFLKSLQGSVAGLQLNTYTGQPGAYSSVMIRGRSSFNSGTEPLYVIDGIPMYTDKLGVYSAAGDGDLAASPLANINPNDIESINVLKDATATSIYGARAANGVIVINTKKGKTGKPQFNFTAKAGFNTAASIDSKYRTVNLKKYNEIWAEGLYNEVHKNGLDNSTAAYYMDYFGFHPYPSPSDPNGINSYTKELTRDFLLWYTEQGENTKDIDWLDEILRTGSQQEYNLSVQGGTPELRYFISGNYYKNEGIVINSDMQRYSGRANIEGKSNKIGYGISITGNYADINNTLTESQYTNPLVAVYDLRPWEQVYKEDGSYNMDAYYNPVALNDSEFGDITNQKQMIAVINPYFTYDITKELIWKTNAGLNMTQLEEFFYHGKYNPQYNTSGYSGQKSIEKVNTVSITNTINWITSFESVHNLNVMLGQEAQKTNYSQVYTAGTNYPNEHLTELGATSIPTDAFSEKRAATLASFFANAQYDYQNKYYFSSSFRTDGSSRFGENNRWASFFSVGAKWRLTQEEFMSSTSDWLNDLTLRTSYGTVGNQDIGYYAARGLYGYGYNYNKIAGSIHSQIENPDLKWETVAKFNIGTDVTLFNALTLGIDYYNQQTRDMIFNVPISLTTGHDGILKNMGKMENQGVEFLINAQIIKTKELSLNANFSLTANKNKIIKLAQEGPIEGTYSIRKEGEAYYTFYLPEYAGVDSQTGEPMWYKGSEGYETTKNYSEAEQRIVGNADPKVYGAFGMNLKFKHFDFSFDLGYNLGNKILNSGFTYDMQVGHYFIGPVSNYVFDNRWQQPGDITDVPQFVAFDGSNANELSTRFLMNGSYARMKSMTVGYTFPHATMRSIGGSNLRLFATAENVFTIRSGDFIGFDPQTRANGLQQWAYPVPFTLIFGLSLGF